MHLILSVVALASLIMSSDSIVPCSRLDGHNTRLDVSNTWVETPDGDIMKGKYFPNYSFKKVKTFVVQQCDLQCEFEQRCQSYNYNRVEGSCELNTIERLKVARNNPTWVQHEGNWEQLLQGLLTLGDWDYYSHDALVMQGKEVYNPCKESNCGEDELCSPLPPNSRKLESDYSCQSTQQPLSDFYADWSVWSSWSTCTVTCGRGSQSRTRTCPGDHKWKCQGISEDRTLCEMGICPYWSHWDSWSYCNTASDCGSGTKTRVRTCATDNINFSCTGNQDETINCRLPSCDAPIALENGTFGRVYIYDDSNEVIPTWKGVCQDLAWSLETRRNVYKTVCGFFNLFVSDVVTDPNNNPPLLELFLKPTSCSDTTNLMQCQHDGWMNHPDCNTQLYVACAVPGDSNTLTYNTFKQFCEEKLSALCNYEDIFPNNDNIPTITGIMTGDHWAPLGITYNEWVQVGNSIGRQGLIHGDLYGPPCWGDEPPCYSSVQLKSNVYCCKF